MLIKQGIEPHFTMNQQPVQRLRLLVIEDNRERIEIIKEWLPEDFIPVFASSAGRAIGILNYDKGRVYTGIMLDHDLGEQAVTEEDFSLSGSDVVKVVLKNVHLDTPVFVHSMNVTRAAGLVRRLEAAGFYVTRIPFPSLTKKRFLEWLEEIHDLWKDY